jgi:hypothetical protein
VQTLNKALRLTIHLLTTGQVAASVSTRSWRGAETWDRRLVPPRPLGTPPPPPPGLLLVEWHLLWTAWRVAGLDEAHLPAAVAASAPPPGGTRGVGRTADVQLRLF